jgi:hypothetical protein
VTLCAAREVVWERGEQLAESAVKEVARITGR